MGEPMTIEKWASIAEIVSGVAVVITLVFLILGIQENTAVQRATAYSDLLDSLNRFQIAQMTDPDSVRVWSAFVSQEGAELEGDDRMRLNLAMLTVFRIYESAFYSEQAGLIDGPEQERFNSNICNHLNNVRAANVEDLLRATMTDDFMGYIEAECD